MHSECNCSDIVIIQGDTSQTNVTIEGVDHEAIQEVYFSCGKLGLSKQLSYDSESGIYILLFTSEETSSFKPIVTNFDITLKLFNDEIITGLYQGRIIVSDKNNPVEVQ